MVILFLFYCNGLKDSKRVDLLKERLKQHKVDICFLQETRVDSMNLGLSIQARLEGKVYWSLTNNRGKGVGIYIRNSFDCNIRGFRFDLDGRSIYVDIDFENYSFRLVNVYVPTVPKERKTFFQEMYSVLLCSRPIILGGDFNCIENPRLDKRGGNPDRGREGWKELSLLINDFDLVDCFRHTYPSLKQYTWRRRDVSCRLDRIYISSCLTSALTEIRHMLYPHSDHLFVALTLSSFDHIKMGSSYWKFNNSLLQDMCYVDYMKVILKDFIHDLPTDDNFLVWWDNLKLFIKNQTILFSKNKKKREHFELNLLRK
jgi:exonuclease III